ncbi:hypothetical protein KM043_006228 [Ampulex compressa]|nr:hypothetical protein KM043_006228 [Ampulex compressa]
MAPRAVTAKKTRATAGRGVKADRKKQKESRKRYESKLKGWLKSPADWARFEAWAKVNAQPRKIPEPEPIVRASKPLFRLKKRMQILSKPRKRADPRSQCRRITRVRRAALRAVPSERTIELAWPRIRIVDHCREFPTKIPRAALTYEATPRILEIGKPRILLLPEQCSAFEVSKAATSHVTTARERTLALAKKLQECPELLSERERDELFTSAATRKSALRYKITPRMIVLSLPAYKVLKHRNDENAISWKRRLLEESEAWGKEAPSEQRERRKGAYERRAAEEEGSGEEGEEEDAASRREERDGEIDEAKEDDSPEKEEEARKLRKNAWRFEPPPCKEDPYRISPAALKGKSKAKSKRSITNASIAVSVPARVEFLAEARVYEDSSSERDPFKVAKGALSGKISERVQVLARPSRPRSPIERDPPREKDRYGMPIFEKPVMHPLHEIQLRILESFRSQKYSFREKYGTS